jgi:hypothetical protein
MPLGVSQYSAISAVSAISAANAMAYVNLHDVIKLHVDHTSYNLPVCSTDGYAQFDINKLGDIDAQRSRNRPDAQHLGYALHDTPCKSRKECERQEDCKRPSQTKDGSSAYIKTDSEDSADGDHLVSVSSKPCISRAARHGLTKMCIPPRRRL